MMYDILFIMYENMDSANAKPSYLHDTLKVNNINS